MKKIIKWAINKFRPGTEIELSNDRLTNQRMLEELASHFKSRLDFESVGKRMIYPMSFNILMDPFDYNDRRQSFHLVLPEIVAKFYDIIDDMRKTFPKYEPPAKYWYFQFSACQMGTIKKGEEAPLIVRKGHITTVANLLVFDIKNRNNVSVDDNIRVSMKLDDSNVMNDFNVNLNTIRNLDIISDGTFIYDFDITLDRNTQRINDNSNIAEVNGIAELSYSRGGRNYRFTMKDNLIHISGKNEMRKGRSFFILESPDIKDSHVQIRYLPDDKNFQIAAYGPTRLNDRKIEESKGGDVKWYNLANNSGIFINNEISVRFVIK